MALLPYCSFILKPCSVLSSCLRTAGPKGPSDPIVTKGISSFRFLTCRDDFVPFISPEELLPLEILHALASVTYLHFLSEAACGILCLLPRPGGDPPLPPSLQLLRLVPVWSKTSFCPSKLGDRVRAVSFIFLISEVGLIYYLLHRVFERDQYVTICKNA